MDKDLVLGEEEGTEEIYYEHVEGYTYTEFIAASCDALAAVESGNFMTKDDADKAQEVKRLSLEMLQYCVKKMHDMLFINDIAV